MKNNLPALVGDTPFWMDTLSVNQRNPDDVVAIVRDIPDIFRDAARTIAIREPNGFYRCCEEAVPDCQGWADFNDRLMAHSGQHRDHLREESYLRRVWTLQVCLLPRTIQFAVAPTSEQLTSPISINVILF